MATTKWSLDPAHSEILFKLKHLMITNVTGQFADVEGNVESEGDDFLNSKISFSAKVASINTNNEQRDTHLKSADFFDAEKYPTLKFVSTGTKKIDDESFELQGDLTIKDVTKSVKLTVEFGGIQKDPWGNTKAGFSLKGSIKRSDWGLNWNATLETGGVLVSEDVKILADVQLAKQ